ncbi:MAG TPA: ATP-binding protein [Chloroflexota bacterium]|nr:ATP-binding protein [Chloroflexota bacterium]
MLIAIAGLPGTGKSRLGRALGAALDAVVLDKDAIRAALFPSAEIEYSTEQDDLCLSIMLQVAGYLFRKEPRRAVILDGRPFARRYQRAAVAEFAEAGGIALRFVECVCSDETARARLERDAAASAHPAGNRDYALYQALKERFEPIEEPKLLVDTDQPFETCLARCLAYVRTHEGMSQLLSDAGPRD